jgi:hypothetical protein
MEEAVESATAGRTDYATSGLRGAREIGEPAVLVGLRALSQSRKIKVPAAFLAKAPGEMPIDDQAEAPSTLVTPFHQTPPPGA